MGSRVVWVKQHLGTENFIRLTVKSLRKAFYNFREFAISIITNTLIATPMVASKVVRIVSWQVSRQRVANFATRPRPRWAQARHQSDRWRIGACLRHAGTSAAQAPPRYSRRYHSSIQRSWGGGQETLRIVPNPLWRKMSCLPGPLTSSQCIPGAQRAAFAAVSPSRNVDQGSAEPPPGRI